MKDRFEFDGFDLPPDLAELDAELSSIAYEERPSFGPELEAELARAWSQRPPDAPRSVARQLMAAGVAGLLMVALGVPSARASLVRWVDSFRTDEPVAASMPEAPAQVSLLYEVPDAGGPEAFDPLTPPLSVEARAAASDRDGWDGPEVTFPEIADRSAAEQIILDSYPEALQQAGIGGTVGVLLWVEQTGEVDVVSLGRSSGVPALDEVALRVAPSFTFTPARRRGRPVDTWVEFDVVFRAPAPDAPEVRPLPEVVPVGPPPAPEGVRVDVVPDWSPDVVLPSPVRREAGDLLAAALGPAVDLARLGSIERILAGDPPAGTAPTAWRSEVSAVLEAAMVRDPDNPAPLLALGRIRTNQGLRTEARVLFERGLQRAVRGGDNVSPAILAELHYERGSLIKQSWLGSRNLGRVPAEALPREACAQARSSGGAASGYASTERLIAWNYLCPAELGRALEESFEHASRDAQREFAVMMGSFRSAVEAFPGHVGANTEILLGLADDGRWEDVLDGSRRFVWASQGHPYGLLLSAVALQRMGRSEAAEGQFRLALEGLPDDERESMLDIEALLAPRDRASYVRGSEEGRAAWRARFFAPLDPIRSTEVNEREVEHLARAAYAHLRFSGVGTDAGRVWIRYGRPDVIRVFGEGIGLRTEFWDYGPGPDITFHRPASSVRMDLTSEARVYVDDLMSVLPHRYGSDARTVEPLDGQVSRFRGQAEGVTDLEIHTRVPAALAGGPADSLDLALFLLDGRGGETSVRSGRIPAVERPLALQVAADPGVADVRVELFDPSSGRAFVLDQEVASRAGQDRSAAAVSDLLLTRPAAPGAGPVHRNASWLEPFDVLEPEVGASMGALVEYYHPVGAGAYALRAEVEGPAAGAVRPLPIQPAGERGFRAAWDREPPGPNPGVEFLNLDLADVPAGAYTLRVFVDRPGGSTPLVAERRFRRR